MQMMSTRRTVWEYLATQSNGTQFTIPEIRQQHKMDATRYTTIHTTLAELIKKGMVKKTAPWNGQVGSLVIYEVVDNSIKPNPVSYDTPYMRRKLEKTLPTKKPVKGGQDIASQIIALASQLTESQSLREYTTAELAAEISRRHK